MICLNVFSRTDLGADIWDPRQVSHPAVVTGGQLHRDVLLVGGAHLHHGDPGHHLTPAGAGDGGLGEGDLAAGGARHLVHLAHHSQLFHQNL